MSAWITIMGTRKFPADLATLANATIKSTYCGLGIVTRIQGNVNNACTRLQGIIARSANRHILEIHPRKCAEVRLPRFSKILFYKLIYFYRRMRL